MPCKYPYHAYVVLDHFPQSYKYSHERFSVKICWVLGKEQYGDNGDNVYIVRINDTGEVRFFTKIFSEEDQAQEYAETCYGGLLYE